MIKEFTDAEVLKIILPAIIAIFAWLANEYKKRKWEEYKRKEERYVLLIQSLKGFYEGVDPEEAKAKKEKFMQQLNVCWLYCPDTVIKKAYNFLDHVHTKSVKNDEEKEKALGDFVSSIRHDLLGKSFWFWNRSKLGDIDFKHLKAT